MSHWVRLWDDMPNDPKWRVVAKRARRPISEVVAVFVHMMLNAASGQERGTLLNWSDEDVAAALDAKPQHVKAIREAMQGKTLDGDHLTGWENRQPLREDGAAERAKAWRERKKAEKSASERDGDGTEPDPNGSNAANVAERNRTPDKSRVDSEADQKNYTAPAPEAVSDDELQGALLEAVYKGGGTVRRGSSPALELLAPIRGLIDAGFTLRSEILPVVRARSKGREISSWSYFVEAIHDARNSRAEAARPRLRVINSHPPPGDRLDSRPTSNPALDAVLGIMNE